MKLSKHFDDFLENTVNLNPTRIATLDARVKAVSDFLATSDYEPKILRFTPQGSWAHKTIIKPPNEKDFDADLVVIIEQIKGWSAKQYVDRLYDVLKANGTYADKIEKNTRCVTINYAGDFHLDVVPCIQIVQNGVAYFWVCNRTDVKFEQTAPEAYTDWLARKNQITGQNHLRKVTRLFKYLRDIKQTFSVKSILATTLLGERINEIDEVFQDAVFADVPTALKEIFGRLDDWLQDRPNMPTITNPVLPSEEFNRHWDQDKYANFREKVHTYREWIDDAFAEPDNDESIRKWRRVFGEDFAKGDVVEKGRSVASIFLRKALVTSTALVSGVRQYGRAFLNGFPLSLPHVQAPPWPAGGKLQVTIQAEEAAAKNSAGQRAIQSGDIVGKSRWLHFVAKLPTGLPSEYVVKWRVVNTGEEAYEDNGLRGAFYDSDDKARGDRWESTKYTGVHWVEAFIINKRNNRYMGKSEPFFVVIE
jgi:hypothetical protein